MKPHQKFQIGGHRRKVGLQLQDGVREKLYSVVIIDTSYTYWVGGGGRGCLVIGYILLVKIEIYTLMNDDEQNTSV